MGLLSSCALHIVEVSCDIFCACKRYYKGGVTTTTTLSMSINTFVRRYLVMEHLHRLILVMSSSFGAVT
jgi:hypothetical protein